MPLIVENGTGVSDANSYVGLAEANDYFALKGITVNLTEADLINATQYLDLTYGTQYAGRLRSDSQSLLWPRSSFTDGLGRRRDGDIVPEELKVAAYEAAKLSSLGTLFAVPSPDSNVQSFSNSVDGAVSESKTFFGPTLTETDRQRALLRTYLRPILDSSTIGGINGRRVK